MGTVEFVDYIMIGIRFIGLKVNSLFASTIIDHMKLNSNYVFFIFIIVIVIEMDWDNRHGKMLGSHPYPYLMGKNLFVGQKSSMIIIYRNSRMLLFSKWGVTIDTTIAQPSWYFHSWGCDCDTHVVRAYLQFWMWLFVVGFSLHLVKNL